MSIPKEPRQQMINIMYLVLIAMLAMNVSNEIVNAFKLLDSGIKSSNNAIDKKVEGSFKQFSKAVEKNPEGQIYLDKANELNGFATEFIGKVNDMRGTIMGMYSESMDAEGIWPKKADDQAETQKYMVEEGNADVLMGYIAEYEKKMKSVFEGENMTEKDRQSFDDALLLKAKGAGDIPADAHNKDSYGKYVFNQMPMVSVVTLLDKYMNDAKNSAAAGVDILKSKVSEEEILYDAFDVAIVPSGRKLIQGDTFEAEVFLTASSSASKPSVSINGKGYPTDASGRANYKVQASSLGKKTIKANLSYKDGFGKSKTVSKSFEYEVVPPPDHVPVVSATKMNAFYIGLDNPVSASITGVRKNKTNVSMSGGGTIRADGSGYMVNVSSPGEVNVNLSGTNEQGKSLSYSVPFRAKRIPDPVAKVGKSTGGSIKSGEFKAQPGLRAELADFLFDAKFRIVAYELTRAEKGADLVIVKNDGGKYNGQSSSLISKAKPNDIYYFDKIKAKGPDGKTRSLPSIVFKIY